MYVRELVLSYRARPGPPIDSNRSLKTPREAANLLLELLANEAVEVFGILCLTIKHRFLAYQEVSRGCLDTTCVHPRDVFKGAILANSAGLILAHNHPSGDPTPSADDAAITQRLKQVGEIVGVEVMDHIIIGHDSRYFSFREAGVL